MFCWILTNTLGGGILVQYGRVHCSLIRIVKGYVHMEKARRDIRGDQIDLLELYYALKKRILLILAAGLLGALSAFAYTELLVTPIYSATASMLVLTKETTLTSLADLQLGSQLTQDYSRLIMSYSVLEKAIDNLGLDMSAESLESSITLNNQTDTRIMDITVSNPDPETARALAEEVGNVSAQFIGEKMGVEPPEIIERVKLPMAPVSPNTSRNVMMGGLAGIALVAGIICIMTIMDDTIRSEEDIVQYLGVPALAQIPDRKDYISGGESWKKPKKKKRRRRHK